MKKEDRVILCLGCSGAGKSTLAYSLMKCGWQLMSDDLIAITNDLEVLPGIPRIKLWQDALKTDHYPFFQTLFKILFSIILSLSSFSWEYPIK